MGDDHEKQKFKDFLVEKFGSLSKAFDKMDANLSGSLSLVEFQAQVSTVLRYCSAADARRLFLSFNQDPGAKLTWDELGITAPEWRAHVIERNREQRIREMRSARTKLMPLGSSPRQQDAHQRHALRLEDGRSLSFDHRGEVAFWGPLPSGWGKPPHFAPPAQASKPMWFSGSLTSTPLMTPSASRTTLKSARSTQ